MANVTIQEFSCQPNTLGDLQRPGNVVPPTTVASPGSITLQATTRYVVVTADADCRIGFGAAAVASGTPVLSAVENGWRVTPSTVLQFA